MTYFGESLTHEHIEIGTYTLKLYANFKLCSRLHVLQFDDFTKLLQNHIISIYCQLFDVPLTQEFIQIED